MKWIILNDAQRAEGEALNDSDAALGARRVTEPTAGDLLGAWLVPLRVLDDPAFARWRPLLADWPKTTAEPGVLFPPPFNDDNV